MTDYIRSCSGECSRDCRRLLLRFHGFMGCGSYEDWVGICACCHHGFGDWVPSCLHWCRWYGGWDCRHVRIITIRRWNRHRNLNHPNNYWNCLNNRLMNNRCWTHRMMNWNYYDIQVPDMNCHSRCYHVNTLNSSMQVPCWYYNHCDMFSWNHCYHADAPWIYNSWTCPVCQFVSERSLIR